METNIYEENLVSPAVCRVDRFVFPRESVADMRRRRSWHGDAAAAVVDIWDPDYQKQKNYKSYFDEAFGMSRKINQQVSTGATMMKQVGWPCVPRKEKCMTMADCILDLPSYNFFTFPDLLDWSHKNILVAALGSSYHMFSCEEQRVIGMGIAQHLINTCKFDPRGDSLLLGTEVQGAEIHDASRVRIISKMVCVCKGVLSCTVTAIDWSPTGNSFIMGCSNGMLTSWTKSGELISKYARLVRVGNPIISTKVSPDTRYVAVATAGCPFALVLMWPHLKYHYALHFRSKNQCKVKVIAWHSWRSALLAVGAESKSYNPRISLIDVPRRKSRDSGIRGSPRALDTMLFSHRTGEMVLGLWDPVEDTNESSDTRSSLVVMSDHSTVVDQNNPKIIMDRIRTMVFNPDGTKIATASAGEDLTIWNFLPEDKNKMNSYKRAFHANPAYFDEVTKGFVIR